METDGDGIYIFFYDVFLHITVQIISNNKYSQKRSSDQKRHLRNDGQTDIGFRWHPKCWKEVREVTGCLPGAVPPIAAAFPCQELFFMKSGGKKPEV